MIHTTNFFTKGGVSLYKLPSAPTNKERRIAEGVEGYYGWGGYGGSQIQWHPEEKIGFGYIPSYLFWIDITNDRARMLQKEVLQCVRNLKDA
jgi:hypothetical protein